MLDFKSRRGRPRKFGRPARPVTLTLPTDVITRLAAVDDDLGRAIVTLVDGKATASRRHLPRVASMASYGRRAVILVPPMGALRRLRGVQLIPVGNGQSLIALDHPHAIPQLELDLRDALDRSGLKRADRTVLESVAEMLREARQSNALTVAERSIIVLEGRRRPRR
jgi:hypothetical protein